VLNFNIKKGGISMAEVKSLEVNQEAIEPVDELEEELEVYEEIEIEELSIDGFCGVY